MGVLVTSASYGVYLRVSLRGISRHIDVFCFHSSISFGDESKDRRREQIPVVMHNDTGLPLFIGILCAHMALSPHKRTFRSHWDVSVFCSSRGCVPNVRLDGSDLI